jgi:hypothetical protein
MVRMKGGKGALILLEETSISAATMKISIKVPQKKV